MSSGVWFVGFPWPGRRFPSIQFEMLKWKVGPWGRWTIVRPVGFFRSSLSTMTAVYLRLQVCEVSFCFGLQDVIGKYDKLETSLSTQNWSCKTSRKRSEESTYFVAKEQISLTENL